MIFRGTYETEDGKSHHTDGMDLEEVDRETVDYSAGITSSYAVVCPVGTPDDAPDDAYFTVDLQEWDEQICQQEGGHHWTDSHDPEDPEINIQFCTNCGAEK